MNPVVRLQKTGIILTKLLPKNLHDPIACCIGILCALFLTRKRRCIAANVRHIFSGEVPSAQKEQRLVLRTFMNFARTMVDFFRLDALDKDDFDVECHGLEHLLQARTQNRGCILITAHIGNWDYAGAYLAANGVPMSAIVEETDQETFELYTKHRERTGMKTFSLQQAGYAILHTIKGNRVLAVLADRDIMGTGITVDFFTGKRKIPGGLGEIVLKQQIPVVFAYMVLRSRKAKTRYLGIIEEPKLFQNGIDAFNTWLVKKYEMILRQYPDQWFVFHSEWIV